MNDKELADKVVALGVGSSSPLENTRLYCIAAAFLRDDQFVRDWRVAGQMMEKCVDANCIVDCALIGRTDAFHMAGPYVAECNTEKKLGIVADGDNIPRAIIEACVQALEQNNE